MNAEPNTHTACIAVLPFKNLSGSRQQDYFAEGFVEELITDLSHFSNLQVISSFTSRKIGAGTRDEITRRNRAPSSTWVAGEGSSSGSAARKA